MRDFLTKIDEFGVIPVIALNEPKTAPYVAKALNDGGLPVIEVTLRNEMALECLSAIRKTHPEVLAGAGTVHSVEQVKQAMAAGAQFIVSPGFKADVVDYCISNGIPTVPGCATASEIEMAMDYGLSTLKFFPSESLGGVNTMKQLHGPYREIKFIPTSGINFDNISFYLSQTFVTAVGGSFIAPKELIEREDWEQLVKNCRRAIGKVLRFEFSHVLFNNDIDNKETDNMHLLNRILSLGISEEGGRANFLSLAAEDCNENISGKKGRIGFYSASIKRALAYFKRNNIPIKEDALEYDIDGKLSSFCLAQEVGGFVINIMQKR